MDTHETNQSSLNNSDTSRLMRELNVHLNQSNDSSIDGMAGLQNTSDSDIKMSGDGSREQTLTQLMKTMYNSAPRQQIVLQGNDVTNSFSVYGQEVDVLISAVNTTQISAGSNKVKITPVVNFDWDPKYYVGNLVAVHRDNTYMAYVLKGKSGGNVRIINRKTAERWLIKCVEGRVVDVAFAHSDSVILAAVDEIGNLYVHEMQESEDGHTSNELLLHIQRPENTTPSEYHRVIWCPYIPDESEDSLTDSSNLDSSRVLVLTHGEKAEIWSIDMVSRDYGTGPLNPHEVKSGMISIESHEKPIIDAAFSPDGTALASASLDGEVKFFQVYLYEGTSPRCLHQWKPHEGKPVSCLFFLDDHKNFSPDAQLWKFAVTGANKNQELKVWSCESWRCLQTIRFLNPPNMPTNFTQEICLKASIDLSAKYLALSDTNKKVLYILQIHQDTGTNSAHISSISEFMLAQPCLSLAILDASKKRFKRSANDTHFDEITTGELIDEDDEEDQSTSPDTTGVQIRLYSVHTKALQELLIRYKPECSVPQSSPPSISSLSQDDTGLRDTLSDISMSVEGNSMAEGDTSSHVLMTPEAFTSNASPSKHSVDGGIRSSMSDTSTFTHVTAMNDDLVSPRSSTDISIVSPGSTLVNTPNSLRDGIMNRSQELTPSNVPLPPITSGEEDDLASPKGLVKVEKTETTPVNPNPQLSALEEFFNTKGSSVQSMKSLDSTTSTGAYEPEVKAKTPRKAGGESYDEDDREVADVLGMPIRNSGDALITSTGEFSQQGDLVSIPLAPTEWPQPPDVSIEAPRHHVDKIKQEEEDNNEDEDDEDFGDDIGRENEEETEDVQIEEVIDSIRQDDEEKELGRGGDGSSTYRIDDTKGEKIVQVIRETREVIDKNALKELHSNINLIVKTMQVQQEQISELKKQLSDQHQLQVGLQQQQLEHVQLSQGAVPPNLEEHLGKVEDVVTSRVERAISSHHSKENQRLKDMMNQMQSHHREQQKQLQGSILETVGASVSQGLDRSVRAEIKQTLIPCVNKTLEPIKEQHHLELAQKLTATDSLLKDNIAKMVRSKQTIEAIGQAAGNAIHAPIQAAYREAFQNMVVPSFERASQNMFKQLNDAFQKGTREYTSNLETHMDQVRKRQLEARDPVIGQLQSLIESFQQSSENLKSQILTTLTGELKSQMNATSELMQEKLLQHVRTAVREEVSLAVREHGASISSQLMNHLRSGAATPIQVSPEFVSAVPTQVSVTALLHAGKINEAFQQALSAANLDLVVYVCQKADFGQVFSQPNILDQPVLLSLIQQLSADLTSHTELKIKYLSEAIMNLDPKNHVTREHMRTVMYSLQNKLKAFISNRPNDQITRNVRMVLMATQALLTM